MQTDNHVLHNAKPANLLVAHCSTKQSLVALDILDKQGIATPIYAIVRPEIEDAFRKRFPEVFVHPFFAAIRGLPQADFLHFNNAPFTKECQKTFVDHAYSFYDVLYRYAYSMDLSFQEAEYIFYKQVTYWNAILSNIDTSAVLFRHPPHNLYDMIILYLCRQKNIQTMMFTIPTSFDLPGALACSDYRELAHFLNDDLASPDSLDSPEEQRVNAYFQRIRSNNFQRRISPRKVSYKGTLKNFAKWPYRLGMALLADMKMFVGGARDITHLNTCIKERNTSFELSYKDTNFPRLKIRMDDFREYRLRRKSQEQYKKLSTTVCFSESYIYFPLASQPESSTNPHGGTFAFQLLTANVLAHALPPGWKLYIKEHPAQFWADHSMSCYRQTWFYDTLVALPNTYLVDIQQSPFELINNSKATAVALGSTALESLACGVPVLAFGHPWYKNAPGVFAVDNLNEACEALNQISSGYKIPEDDLKRYFINSARRECRVEFNGPQPSNWDDSELQSYAINLAESIADSLGRSFKLDR